MSKRLKDFLTGLALGLVLSVLITALDPSGTDRWTHRVSDGTFVSAVLLLAYWGLVLARNQGTFDVAAYGLKAVAQSIWPAVFGENKDANAAEYAQRKAKERQSALGFLFAGLVYSAATMVLLALYAKGI